MKKTLFIIWLSLMMFACKKPTSVEIKQIWVKSFPNTNSNGEPWDNDGKADLFVKIYDEKSSLIYTSKVDSLYENYPAFFPDKKIIIPLKDDKVDLTTVSVDVHNVKNGIEQAVGYVMLDVGGAKKKKELKLENTSSGTTVELVLEWNK